MFNRTQLRRGLVLTLTLYILILPATLKHVFSQQKQTDEPTLEELFKTAQDATVDEKLRLKAIEGIDSLNTAGERVEKAIPVLNRLLNDDSAAIRIKSARALLELEQPVKELLPAVVSALKDNDPDTRVDAGYLLRAFDYEAGPAIAAIVDALTDDEPRLRRVAASVLGEIGPDFKETSIPPLTDSLEDSDRSVRLAAGEALAKVDGPIERVVEVFVEAVRENDSNRNPFSSEYETIEKIGQLGGDAVGAVATLNEVLKRGGTYRQAVAAKALANIGPESRPAIDGLVIALRNGDAKGMPFVHRSWCASDEAARALVIIGVDAVPVLIAALTDPDERVRANAAEALGDIPAGAKTSVPKLADLTEDDDPVVRSHAAWALGKLGRTAIDREAIGKESGDITTRLVKMLFENTEWNSAPASGGIAQDYSVPWHAVEAIARIKPDRKKLIAALDSSLREEQTINFAVATTIASIGPEAKSLTHPLQKLLEEKNLAHQPLTQSPRSIRNVKGYKKCWSRH